MPKASSYLVLDAASASSLLWWLHSRRPVARVFLIPVPITQAAWWCELFLSREQPSPSPPFNSTPAPTPCSCCCSEKEKLQSSPPTPPQLHFIKSGNRSHPICSPWALL
ncbi:ubiquitin-conjugating enzyme E2 G2 [Platysternon megacephalum]|uniref:Ubiquitin-conjugating enzyme E2 G2 n=1 Tax=Platysternon megacephalum TaxID=55544 RepID=A0A4D9EX33_9SAUR|nr:ubiquitin-conjugating enzyme E2 G2 [Platysternon megacephalum]